MDGVVRAFYNTCRHRGAPVVTEDKGKAARLMCRYHNWTYKTDGELVGVPEAHDFTGLDKSCRGLIAVRCEMYGKLIFVNFDQGAMSLREWMGPIAQEWEEFQFDRVRLAARHCFELKCNWKVAMEANMEVYHVPFIHPETVAPLVDSKRNVNTMYPNGHARMIAPGPKDSNREHMRPKLHGVPQLGLAAFQLLRAAADLLADRAEHHPARADHHGARLGRRPGA
jgi:phenylpropionate dioxygenase-like ring-hydroxylating dioxygenase large terminal subunit